MSRHLAAIAGLRRACVTERVGEMTLEARGDVLA
jgi:hypothetical protein